jgi:hypothetical protein
MQKLYTSNEIRLEVKVKKVKGKAITIHAIKAHGAINAQLHSFKISAPDGGELFASHSSHFTPWGKSPTTH